MPDTLRSVLCGEERWSFNRDGDNMIRFRPDGTGDLLCCIEMSVFIAAEFDWKGDASLDQVIDVEGEVTRNGRRLLGEFDLDITLTTRRPAPFQTGPLASGRFNEHSLTDEAFLPKKYTVRLEKGNFKTPQDVLTGVDHPLTQHYALRIVFDKSPYPEESQWKEVENGPKQAKFWEWKEFTGRKSEDLKKQAEVDAKSKCIVM